MFFDRLNKFALFLAAVSGTAVAASVLGEAPQWVQILFSGMVIVFTTIDLVISSPQMARLHSDLYRQFVELERDLVLAGEDISDDECNKFIARRLEIEAKEPSVLTALNLLCHNEVVRAGGYDKQYLRDVPTCKRWLANFWSFDDLESKPASHAEG
jgi:hypothetical protein